MNLINELGIEKCREIVDGAKWSTHFRTDTKEYVCCPNEAHFYFRENVERGVEFIRIDDLRTAIADYDNHWYGQSEEKELEQYAILSQEKIEGGAVFVGDNSAIVQAMRNITDDCTDIRNHISPNTKVIER